MKQHDHIGIVPAQFVGQEIEVEATKELKDEAGAKSLYNVAKRKLLDVNNWKKIAGTFTAQFQIIDDKGEMKRHISIPKKLPALLLFAAKIRN